MPRAAGVARYYLVGRHQVFVGPIVCVVTSAWINTQSLVEIPLGGVFLNVPFSISHSWSEDDNEVVSDSASWFVSYPASSSTSMASIDVLFVSASIVLGYGGFRAKRVILEDLSPCERRGNVSFNSSRWV